jgi:hypothetical protein
MMAIAGVLALRASLAAPATLDVQVAGPLTCPDASAVVAALEARQVTAPTTGWHLRIEPARDEESTSSNTRLQLDLVRPDGTSALNRSVDRAMPARGGDCDAAADAVALIVERHLRTLAWATPARVSTPPESDGMHAAITLAAARTPPRPHGPALTLLAGPSWSSDGPRPLGPAVEVRARVRGPAQFGVGLLSPGETADEALPGGGRARLQAWPLLVRALAEPATGRWRPLAALDAGIHFERGETTGIARPAVRWRAVLLAGGSVGLAWQPHARWRLAAEAGLARLVHARDFDVGGHGPVLAPARWQARAGLRLGYVLWP